MKKNFFYFVAFSVIALFFASCSQEEPSFDEGLLLGKWKNTTKNEYYTYLVDYTGKTWNEDEDVTEDEARKFNWTLEKSSLEHIMISHMTGEELVPKYYTVTELTANSLKYKDDFGKVFTFSKVK